MTEKQNLPPNPKATTVQYMENYEVTVGQAVKTLSELEGQNVEQTSCIDERDVPRYALLLNIGQDPDFRLTFIEGYAHTELRLMKSSRQKRGGVLMEIIALIAKQQPLMAEQGGFFSNLFNRGKR
jgi:hypothetical protein